MNTLQNSIESAFQEVEDATNFRMFALLSGPTPNGGALSVTKVQTGRTLKRDSTSDGTFESYLGELYPIIKQKWIKWLATTYSK